MGLTKGGKKIYITKRKTHKINRRGLTKRRRLTKTNKRNRRGRSRRGRGAGQSVNSDGDKNGENKKWEDKKLAFMEEGKPWYTPPSTKGPMVKPDLDAQQSAQRNNDYLGYYSAADQGLTFGGKPKSKRRRRTRRR